MICPVGLIKEPSRESRPLKPRSDLRCVQVNVGTEIGVERL